jgi:hypothetical protein
MQPTTPEPPAGGPPAPAAPVVPPFMPPSQDQGSDPVLP